jgi:acetyl esterase/lipase
MKRLLKLAAVVVAALLVLIGADFATGRHVGYWLAIRVLYVEAPLPDAQIVRNQPYGKGAPDPKHRFDLYLPARRGFPIAIFVHGGGWTEGDKDTRVGGADIYGNIGRFLAGHGIGTAVISYPLLPDVTWREQIDDVAQAVVAARSAFIARGANPAALFLMGHSAGAQLVTRVALDPGPLARAGGSSALVCGVIPVSGAALDLTDQQTWDLGAKLDYYRERFATGGEPDWQKLASPMTFLTAKAPPFLVIHSGRESKPLRRQSEWLVDRLRELEVPVHLVVVPGGSHGIIVLSLSRSDDTAGPIVVQFITTLNCTH